MCVKPEPASRQRKLASRLPVSQGNTAVGRRMGLLSLWLFALRALEVQSSVALVLAAPTEPVPAPRCPALDAGSPCQACNASQLPVICLHCRAHQVGSSITDQVHCDPAWRRSALEAPYLAHPRHQRVAVARLLTGLQVLCPPLLKRTPCCVHPKMNLRRHQVQVPDEDRRLQCRSMLLGTRLELQIRDRLPLYSPRSTGSSASPYSYVNYRHWLSLCYAGAGPPRQCGDSRGDGIDCTDHCFYSCTSHLDHRRRRPERFLGGNLAFPVEITVRTDPRERR